MNTSFNLWVNNKPRAKDGTFDIFIRVTQNRRHKSLKTGITIASLSDFNTKAKGENWIRGRANNVKKLNEDLAEKLEAIRTQCRELQKKDKSTSKERVIQTYRGGTSTDFIPFLKRIIERFQEAGSYRSAKRYGQLLNKLTAFHTAIELPFDIITVTFLKNFQSSMKGLHQNTVYEHFKNFKAAFNQAIDEEFIRADQNPFRRFKVDSVSTHKEKLTEDEIRRLKALKLDPATTLGHTLNCFLFAFYCGGIRAGDLITLRWENIEDGNLTYVMSKTRKSKLIKKSVPLMPESLEILHNYESPGLSSSDFIFRMLDNKISKLIDREKKFKSGHEVKIYNQIASRNTILNKNLKKIAALAEITKPLTFHIARHSFAQYALDRDMNPKILQAILGHEKFATTENYITTLNNKKVEDAMKGIFSV